MPQLRHGLSARGLLRLSFDLARASLPAPLRPGARSVLDITEYFSATSGGIRTYLLEKQRWVEGHPETREVLVVPGAADAVADGAGTRTYTRRGPRIPFNAPYRFLLSPRVVRRVVEHERPDLIEIGSHLVVPWVARSAARRLGVPIVWFYHGHLPHLIAPDHHRGVAQRRLETLAWAHVRRLARGVRAVLVASRYLAAELAAHGVGSAVQVPLGVDLTHFHPRRRSTQARARLGLPEGPLALFAGRFAREKRLDTVLDAWAEVERRTGARLAFVGDGPQAAALMRHRYAPRVLWLPFERDRERFADLLAAVDLYLAPGPYETFGLSALEAMACGTPVLSVDRGGVAERVADSGAGATYPFNDAAGLAARAIALLGEDLSALGEKGRAFAEARHSWDAAFTAIFDVYRRVLGR